MEFPGKFAVPDIIWNTKACSMREALGGPDAGRLSRRDGCRGVRIGSAGDWPAMVGMISDSS